MGMGEPLQNYDRDDESAAESSPTSTGLRCRRGGSRSRPSACCRRSNGWPASRSCRTWPFRSTRRRTRQRGELVPISAQEARRQRHHRGVQAISAEAAQPDHVRLVRAARRRQRLARRRASPRKAPRRSEIEGQPDSAQRSARYSLRAAVRRGHRSLRAVFWPIITSSCPSARAADGTSAPPAVS